MSFHDATAIISRTRSEFPVMKEHMSRHNKASNTMDTSNTLQTNN